MNIPILTAILSGKWLMEPVAARNLIPIAFKMMESSLDSPEPTSGPRNLAASKVSSYQSAFKVSWWTNISAIPSGSIAVVSIIGPLMKFGGWSLGLLDYAEIIDDLANADNISAIVLNIDSPGGTVAGTATLHDSISKARQKKPVVGIVDSGIAASAGYWIASAAQELYVSQQTDQVGSIGVFVTLADWATHYREYFKLNVKDVYAPESDDKNRIYNDAIAGKEDDLKKELSIVAKQFISVVKRNRSAKLTSDEWSTGKMYFAKDALRIGLIDGIKSLSQVLERTQSLIS